MAPWPALLLFATAAEGLRAREAVAHAAERALRQALNAVEPTAPNPKDPFQAFRDDVPKQTLRYKKMINGVDWSEGSCGQPMRQSPINLEGNMQEKATQKLLYGYDPVTSGMTPRPDGYFTFPKEDVGGIVFEQTYYPLISAQLHTQSEHTYFGKHTLLELQLFHKRPESDPVVAVAFRLQPPPVLKVNRTILGADESRRVLMDLRALGEKAPGFSRPMMHFLQPEKTDNWNSLRINDLYKGGTFWEYPGSSTKPPCAEVVSWLVRREPMSLSPRQAQLIYSNLRLSLGGAEQNSRAVHPLGERKLRVYAVEEGKDIKGMHAPSVEDFVPVGPNPRQDRTERMNGYAQAAFEAANEADQASQLLDYKEQKAAYEYAKQMAPYMMKFVPPPIKPHLAKFEYEGWNPEFDTMKIAESMSKAVGSMAANALKNAADKIVKQTKAITYRAAQASFKNAELANTPPPAGVKVSMFR